MDMENVKTVVLGCLLVGLATCAVAGVEYLGVPWWKRRAMYTGVRIGGWWPWRRN